MSLIVPLQHSPTGGDGDGDVGVARAVARVEVGAAHIVDRSRGEVLRRLIRPAKLLFGLAVDLNRVQHGDASRVH